MKIIIHMDAHIHETEIEIFCSHLTQDIENMIATLRIMNQQMMVMQDGENYLLDVSKISYIEALERKTFQMSTAISIKSLSHHFGRKTILDTISFDMDKGKIWGLPGPSGAGKTTLLHILTGQLKAAAGE